MLSFGTGLFMLAAFVGGCLLAFIDTKFILISTLIHVVSLVESVIYLTKSKEEFTTTYLLNKRNWF